MSRLSLSSNYNTSEKNLFPGSICLEYILSIDQFGFDTFFQDSRAKAAATKTNCHVELTTRILNKRINSSRWTKYAVVSVTGPDQASLDRCLRLLERQFPIFLHRKEYNRRANVTLFTDDVTLPDNIPGAVQTLRSASTMSNCRGLTVKSPYVNDERRTADKTLWKLGSMDFEGVYTPTLLRNVEGQESLKKVSSKFDSDHSTKFSKNEIFGSLGMISKSRNVSGNTAQNLMIRVSENDGNEVINRASQTLFDKIPFETESLLTKPNLGNVSGFEDQNVVEKMEMENKNRKEREKEIGREGIGLDADSVKGNNPKGILMNSQKNRFEDQNTVEEMEMENRKKNRKEIERERESMGLDEDLVKGNYPRGVVMNSQKNRFEDQNTLDEMEMENRKKNRKERERESMGLDEDLVKGNYPRGVVMNSQKNRFEDQNTVEEMEMENRKKNRKERERERESTALNEDSEKRNNPRGIVMNSQKNRFKYGMENKLDEDVKDTQTDKYISTSYLFENIDRKIMESCNKKLRRSNDGLVIKVTNIDGVLDVDVKNSQMSIDNCQQTKDFSECCQTEQPFQSFNRESSNSSSCSQKINYANESLLVSTAPNDLEMADLKGYPNSYGKVFSSTEPLLRNVQHNPGSSRRNNDKVADNKFGPVKGELLIKISHSGSIDVEVKNDRGNLGRNQLEGGSLFEKDRSTRNQSPWVSEDSKRDAQSIPGIEKSFYDRDKVGNESATQSANLNYAKEKNFLMPTMSSSKFDYGNYICPRYQKHFGLQSNLNRPINERKWVKSQSSQSVRQGRDSRDNPDDGYEYDEFGRRIDKSGSRGTDGLFHTGENYAGKNNEVGLLGMGHQPSLLISISTQSSSEYSSVSVEIAISSYASEKTVSNVSSSTNISIKPVALGNKRLEISPVTDKTETSDFGINFKISYTVLQGKVTKCDVLVKLPTNSERITPSLIEQSPKKTASTSTIPVRKCPQAIQSPKAPNRILQESKQVVKIQSQDLNLQIVSSISTEISSSSEEIKNAHQRDVEPISGMIELNKSYLSSEGMVHLSDHQQDVMEFKLMDASADSVTQIKITMTDLMDKSKNQTKFVNQDSRQKSIEYGSVQKVSGIKLDSGHSQALESPKGVYLKGVNDAAKSPKGSLSKSSSRGNDEDIVRMISNRLHNPVDGVLIMMFEGAKIYSTGSKSVTIRPTEVESENYNFESSNYIIKVNSRKNSAKSAASKFTG